MLTVFIIIIYATLKRLASHVSRLCSTFFLALIILSAYALTAIPNPVYAQEPEFEITDNTLQREMITQGLSFPTSMTFVDNNGSILVSEKNTGRVVLVSNGTISEKPILEFNINSEGERGLLGIAAINEEEIRTNIHPDKPNANQTYVLIYVTESELREGEELIRNRVYRYDWDPLNKTLVNQTRILDLPADPGPMHNGGKIALDNQGYLYTVIGDLGRQGLLQNFKESYVIDDTSVIIRVHINGSLPRDNPFAHYGRESLARYYAYGIRNSFGLAVDPITGRLWATENGVSENDEINIVYPGFNSGWAKVMGPISRSVVQETDLFYLKGAEYRDPEFTWKQVVGVTDIEFLNSEKLGAKYANNIFVSSLNNGDLYFFELNDDRTGLKFNNTEALSDKVADSWEELTPVRLATFGESITDIETGPDGFLYVLTYFTGKIYRIVPFEPNND